MCRLSGIQVCSTEATLDNARQDRSTMGEGSMRPFILEADSISVRETWNSVDPDVRLRPAIFSSAEFRQFTNEWGIERKMSSPYYPQSKGIVDNCVKVVKRILGKAADIREDPYLAMLAYRSSPLDCGKSPSELLIA